MGPSLISICAQCNATLISYEIPTKAVLPNEQHNLKQLIDTEYIRAVALKREGKKNTKSDKTRRNEEKIRT